VFDEDNMAVLDGLPKIVELSTIGSKALTIEVEQDDA